MIEQGPSQEDMNFTAPTTGYETGQQSQAAFGNTIEQNELAEQLELRKQETIQAFNSEMELPQFAKNKKNVILQDIECKTPEEITNLNQEGLLSRGVEGIDKIRNVFENGFSVSATPIVGADGEFGATEIPQVFIAMNRKGRPIINQESFKFGEVWDDRRCAETESSVFILSDDVKKLGTFKDRYPMPEVTTEETIPSNYIKGIIINSKNRDSIRALMEEFGIDLPLYLVKQRCPEQSS